MQILNAWIELIAMTLIGLAILFGLLACWRCKSILIKLVALEVLVNLFICCVSIWAARIHFVSLLDICIALSLIMFLGTVAYCQFLMRQGGNDVVIDR